MFALFIASQNAISADKTFRLPAPVSKEHRSIHYTVSPGIELISIVQTISDYPSVFGFLMQEDSLKYKAEVADKFVPFKNHPAVIWFNRISMQPGKMNFSAPSNLMLHTDENLNVHTDLKLDDFVLSRIGGIDSLKYFLGLLRDFAEQTSFINFFNKHNGFYSDLIDGTIFQIDSIDHIKELENFYGMRQKSYNIILVPLYSHVGFGNSLIHTNGEREIFDTMGPQKIKNGFPFFGDNEYLKYITRHEFSHPFINPLTEKYWNSIKGYYKNYDLIPDNARQNVCGDWQECINEFIIRAITVHLGFQESSEIGSRMYAKEKSRGVCNLDKLLGTLKAYSEKRTEYPNFDSFYMNLLEDFKYFKCE